MKIRSFRNTEKQSENKNVRAWRTAVNNSNTTASAEVTQSTAMKLSAVACATECVANSVSKLPLYILNSNTKERVEHPIIKILNLRPNEAMNAAVYHKLMEVNRIMSGNAYALIVRDKGGAPIELIPLPPSSIEIETRKDGKLAYIFTHPETKLVKILTSIDLLHYKGYSEDGINGVSVIKRASDVLNIATSAQKYESVLYANNSQPAGVLQVDTDIKAESKDKIRAEWEKVHSGVDNAFRIAVLDMGFKYHPISMSNKDTQFVENKEVSVADIARFFGVPLYKLSAGAQSYSSKEQNGIEYVTNTLHPIVNQMEQEDTYKLLFESEREQGLQIRRNMMAELRGDYASRGNWYNQMRTSGVFSVNDIRSLEDMADVVGGDSRNASLNYVPLELFEELSKNRNQ